MTLLRPRPEFRTLYSAYIEGLSTSLLLLFESPCQPDLATDIVRTSVINGGAIEETD